VVDKNLQLNVSKTKVLQILGKGEDPDSLLWNAI